MSESIDSRGADEANLIRLLLSEERNEAVHQDTATIRWFRSQVATSAALLFSVNTRVNVDGFQKI